MSTKKKINLEEFGRDLTAEARAGKLAPVIGRRKELSEVILVLSRKTKRNPVLLGEPGVGKTAVAEGLAFRLLNGEVPPHLAGKSLYSLSLGSLLAGTGYRGDFEQRLQDLVNELKRPGSNRLLFIDEIHLITKAGKSEGGMDAANFLKPMLARGEIPCIGATTPAEWKEMIERDRAMERRFQPVEVDEPSYEEAVEILQGLRTHFERHHGVRIEDDAIEAAVSMSILLQPGLKLPDKAVDCLDGACAKLQLRCLESGTSAAASARVRDIEDELERASAAFDLDRVARLRYCDLPAARKEARPSPVLDGAFVRSI